MDFCVFESSECRVLASSLLCGGVGRFGADLGRVAFVRLIGQASLCGDLGFLGGPALANGEVVLAARVETEELRVALALAATFPSTRFGSILATRSSAGVCSAHQNTRLEVSCFVGRQGVRILAVTGLRTD